MPLPPPAVQASPFDIQPDSFEDRRVGFHRSLVWLTAGLLLAGCAPQDEITSFTAPAEPRTVLPRNSIRLIAALAPVPDFGHWAFKVSGPEKVITELEPSIVEFLKSVELSAEPSEENRKVPKIAWSLPKGWKDREGGGQFRTFTIDIPVPGGEPLEMSVSHFHQKVKLLENINRWRGQINRNDISTKEIPLVSRPLPMKGGEATLVDVRGYEYARAEVPQAQARDEFEYELPEGWKKQTGNVAFSSLTFKVEAGKRLALVTLSNVKGTPEQNLNRWRSQLKLPELKTEELRQTTSILPVGDDKGIYVDYTTKETGALATGIERILGVIFLMNDDQWIAKMSGPKDLVEVQKSNFERFVRSLKPARKLS